MRIIINQMDWDEEAQVCRSLYTLAGPEDRIQTIADTLVPQFDKAEVVSTGKDHLVVRTEARMDTLKKTGNPTAFALSYFGHDAIVLPALVKDGYVHTRLVIVGKVDLADLLSNYEAGVKDGLWSDFKLIRIDDFDPEQQIAGAFTENLTQKQLEVIKTALALGFYNTPRDITLDDLSNIFGISKAAVHNRLQAAERKVIQKFFG